jgi:restriction endonuclease S subunit
MLEFDGNKIKTDRYESFIQHSLLSSLRLDCDYYSPTFVNNDIRIRKGNGDMKTLAEITTALSDGTHDTIEKLGGYLESGVRYITSNEIVSGISATGLYISPEAHKRNKRSEVLPSDILMAVRGSTSVGSATVYPEHFPVANINTAVARLRLNKDIDPYWIVAFLNSLPGRLNTLRIANGVNQLNMNMEEVGNIAVLLPKPQIQRAIGNKIRKAERLKEQSKEIKFRADNKISSLFKCTIDHSEGLYSWVEEATLSSARIDSWFYRPLYLTMTKQLSGRDDLISVSKVCKIVREEGIKYHLDDTKPLYYIEIGDINIATGEIVPQVINRNNLPSRARFSVKGGDILVSTVRPNLKSLALIPDDEEDALCSSGFAVLRSDDIDLSAYVYACLLNDNATSQLMRWNTGATFPAIDHPVVGQVLIPNPGEEEMREIGSKIRQMTSSNFAANKLLNQAISDVMHLIDNTLEEGNLLSESKELERWLEANPSPRRDG